MHKFVLSPFLEEDDAQGITEYGAILAFTCLLIIVVFSFAHGTLGFAMSTSMSTVIGQFDRLNNAAFNAT